MNSFCGGCNKKIQTTIGCVNINSKLWHKECFKCKLCLHVPLTVHSFNEHGGYIYCNKHYKQLPLRSRSLPATPQGVSSAVSDAGCTDSRQWLHASLSREKAESLLKNPGDFLVRTSNNQPGEYIISVKWDGKFEHLFIPRNPVTGKLTYAKKDVSSIPEYLDLQLRSGLPVSDESSAILKTQVTPSSVEKKKSPGTACGIAGIVKPVVGSVCEQQVDAIVNYTTSSLDLQKSGDLSKAILEAAGSQIQRELRRTSSSDIAADDRVIVTNGYRLPCHFVLHVIFSQGRDFSVHDFRGIVRSIFTILQERHLTSVAIPPIGTGVSNYPAHLVATILCEEAAAYLNTTTRPTLTDIRFVVMPIDEENIHAFRQALAPDVFDKVGSLSLTDVLEDAAEEFDWRKRRVDDQKQRLCVVKRPENWTELESVAPYRKIVLDQNSEEYQHVVTSLGNTDKATFANLIYKVERVESLSLFEIYEVSKSLMLQDEGRPNKAILERSLWHGTDHQALDGICQYGFNFGICGKKGKHGQGVYFTEDFAISADDRYSKPGRSGLKCVLRCRVLTGQFTVGNKDMVEPPHKPGSSLESFDSTVDNDRFPTVFVIYDGFHAYPEYIVTFFGNVPSSQLQ